MANLGRIAPRDREGVSMASLRAQRSNPSRSSRGDMDRFAVARNDADGLRVARMALIESGTAVQPERRSVADCAALASGLTDDRSADDDRIRNKQKPRPAGETGRGLDVRKAPLRLSGQFVQATEPLIDHLNDAAGARFDQHGLPVHHGVAIGRRRHRSAARRNR